MTTTGTTDLETFVASAQRVVDYLRGRTPLTDWSVSRIDDEDQVHLHVSDGSILNVGDRVPWGETFCRRMLAGADRVVPDSHRNSDYADLAAAATVRAYAGVPILDRDGTTFGTLCGVRAEALEAGERIDQDLLEVFSDLLAGQLALVRASTSERGAAVISAALASSDALTGLMNRRGWDLLAAEAQSRIEALGDHGAVVMIDLDDLKAVNDAHGHQAGDVLLRTAAGALEGAAPTGHSVARYGGDEFVVYAGGTMVSELPRVTEQYADVLATAGIAASVGAAPVLPGGADCVERALGLADAAMFAEKRRRHERRRAADPVVRG